MNSRILFRTGKILLIGACALMAQALAAAEQPKDKEAILEKARASYYSLKKAGFTGVSCNLVPNWKMVFVSVGVTDPDKLNDILGRLSKVRFALAVSAEGKAAVKHNEAQADTEEQAAGFRQLLDGQEQTVTGFFETWSAFVISPAFPDAKDKYGLSQEKDQYVLSYTERSGTDIRTAMDRDYKIQSLRVVTREFDSEILPKFATVAGAYLLSGYDATYVEPNQASKTDLHVSIENQSVEGFQFPRKVHIKGTYEGNPLENEFVLEGCHATKR
jgi:hypothetical protein